MGPRAVSGCSTAGMITADGGGSNGSASAQVVQDPNCRSWLTKPASHSRSATTHLGTSKWNKIEHRLFCHITQTWRGTPLTSRLAVVELIAATTTTTGLRAHGELDDADLSGRGSRSLDAEMAALNIEGNVFHPEWNYTIAPRVPSPEAVIGWASRLILAVLAQASRCHRAWTQIPLLRASADHHHLRGVPALGPPASIHRRADHWLSGHPEQRRIPSRTRTTRDKEPKPRKITANPQFRIAGAGRGTLSEKSDTDTRAGCGNQAPTRQPHDADPGDLAPGPMHPNRHFAIGRPQRTS